MEPRYGYCCVKFTQMFSLLDSIYADGHALHLSHILPGEWLVRLNLLIPIAG